MDDLLVQVESDAGVTGWDEGIRHSVIPATKAALETYVGLVHRQRRDRHQLEARVVQFDVAEPAPDHLGADPGDGAGGE